MPTLISGRQGGQIFVNLLQKRDNNDVTDDQNQRVKRLIKFLGTTD
jgi:hypothetical protein